MRRFGMVIGIKPDRIEEYKKLHAAAWPDVLKIISECNIRNYSIYLKDNYLFSYFEYTGTDFEIFNIGSGVSYSVDEIVRKILSISGQDIEVNYKNARRKSEIMNVVADIKRAKEKLDWMHKFEIGEGLKNIISSFLFRQSKLSKGESNTKNV